VPLIVVEMAEFAAATGAAGLISLGLQVCGGLVQYYSAWKDSDRETAVLCTRAQSLAQTLELLMSILHTSQGNQSIAITAVEASVVACAGAIQRLQIILAKCSHLPTVTSGGGHASRLKRKMMYPFQRSDLVLCNNEINDLQSNLGIAVQTYQM